MTRIWKTWKQNLPICYNSVKIETFVKLCLAVAFSLTIMNVDDLYDYGRNNSYEIKVTVKHGFIKFQFLWILNI